MHAPEQDSPGDPAGVLALEKQRLGLAIEESEDLGVAADIELALLTSKACVRSWVHSEERGEGSLSGEPWTGRFWRR